MEQVFVILRIGTNNHQSMLLTPSLQLGVRVQTIMLMILVVSTQMVNSLQMVVSRLLSSITKFHSEWFSQKKLFLLYFRMVKVMIKHMKSVELSSILLLNILSKANKLTLKCKQLCTIKAKLLVSTVLKKDAFQIVNLRDLVQEYLSCQK